MKDTEEKVKALDCLKIEILLSNQSLMRPIHFLGLNF